MKFRFRPRTGTPLQLKVKAEDHPRLLPLEIHEIECSVRSSMVQLSNAVTKCLARTGIPQSAKPLGMKWKVATPLTEAATYHKVGAPGQQSGQESGRSIPDPIWH
jgi:hypothetical protein